MRLRNLERTEMFRLLAGKLVEETVGSLQIPENIPVPLRTIHINQRNKSHFNVGLTCPVYGITWSGISSWVWLNTSSLFNFNCQVMQELSFHIVQYKGHRVQDILSTIIADVMDYYQLSACRFAISSPRTALTASIWSISPTKSIPWL